MTRRAVAGVDGATERLRHDIDSGRTGDKIDWPDPAAAPLGTDEEAAGTPVPSLVAEAARRRETGDHRPRRRGIGAAWILISFVTVAVTCILIWGLASRTG
jgi:hypothetical protein